MPRTERETPKQKIFEKVVSDFMTRRPNQVTTYTELGQKAGVTKEGARQLYSKIAKKTEVPVIKSERGHLPPEELDPKVKTLIQEGFTSREIAQDLKIRFTEIQSAHERNNRLQREQRANLVRELRQMGLGNQEISRRTRISISTVTTTLSRLGKNGEKLRLKKPRASKDELAGRDAQVKEAREEGLSRTQIAKKLDLSYYDVGNSLTRLLRAQEVQPKTAFL
jgi:DNA-binding NarL/FixJ family response regulator